MLKMEVMFMKIRLKLSLIVITAVIAILGGILAIILTRSMTLQRDSVTNYVEALGESNAKDVQRRYENYLDVARTLSHIMDSFQGIDPAVRRSRYNENLYGVLESNPNYIGIFTLWYPNVLDGMDAQFANTQGTDSSGQFISYLHREGGQPITLTHYPNYRQVLAETTEERLMEPVKMLGVNGRETLAATVIAPILGAGTMYGVVGIVIDIDGLQDVVMGINPYPGTMAGVFTNDGIVAASSANPDSRGMLFRDSDAEIFGNDMESMLVAIKSGQPHRVTRYVASEESDMLLMSTPFAPGTSKTPWSLMIGIPMDEVMAPVYDMLEFSLIAGGIAMVALAVVIIVIATRITKPIIDVSLTLKDISEGEGDLTKSISIKSSDEVGDLAHYFNLTLEKIRNLVITIKTQASRLNDIGSELSSNMTETAAAVNQITSNVKSIKGQVINQSASVTQTNSTMEQVVNNINKLNDQVESQAASVTQSSSAIEEMLANISSVTRTLVKNGENVISLGEASEIGKVDLQGVASDIQEIARESEGLLEINAVMENIASQTNLLSMNAAIEAAHAGEAGKGFAVVADEIRKLAESSGEQSKTISVVLKKIKDSIDKISRSTETVINRFEAIDTRVKTVAEQEDSIRNAMEEQGQGSKQVLEAIGTLNQITQSVRGGSSEMLQGSKEVIQESSNLERVTQEITNGMNEMASGTEQISIAVSRVNEISQDNKESIDILVMEVSKFKVE